MNEQVATLTRALSAILNKPQKERRYWPDLEALQPLIAQAIVLETRAAPALAPLLAAIDRGHDYAGAIATAVDAIDPDGTVAALISRLDESKQKASAAADLRRIVAKLETDDNKRPSRVARALVKNGVQGLRKAAVARDAELRGDALFVLGKIGPSGEESLTLLIDALLDKNEAIREQVIASIDGWKSAAAPAVPAIVKLIERPG